MRAPLRVPVSQLRASVYEFKWDEPESDGTIVWDKTTAVVVEAHAGGERGFGWTYSHKAAAELIQGKLSDLVDGKDAMSNTAIWEELVREIRNLGRPGIASSAISAVDNALWDLKARLLGVPLVMLLGQQRDSVPAYWSAGFTSYSKRELEREFAEQRSRGFTKFKMKVGREPEADPERVKAARKAIGSDAELFTDANGAYTRKQALEMARKFKEQDVSWFEEPVAANDLDGIRFLRDRCPPGMAIASGEYGYDLRYFHELLSRDCVDVLQVDASRSSGITGFLRAAALAQAANIPVSSHTTPAQHVHVCCALSNVQHIEYFKDHMIVERTLFDGVPEPEQGFLKPDLSRAGNGLELKRVEADRFAA